jgi:hypothetical protein
MIELRRRTPWERLARLWPPYRRQSDEALRAAIRQLVDDPAAPCVIDGQLIIPTMPQDQTAQVAERA